MQPVYRLLALEGGRVHVLEVVVILGDIVVPLGGHRVLGEDGGNRANRLAGRAVNALVGADVVHIIGIPGVNAVHGTDFNARLVFDVDTRAGDYEGHSGLPTPLVLPLFCLWLPPSATGSRSLSPWDRRRIAKDSQRE